MSPLPSPAADLARRLAEHAEAVCRAYLSNGRRCGRYWSVGDVANSPGRSLYVRLHGPPSGPGAAGHWTDAATGEHGDLLDLIRLACGLPGVREAIVEARAFLALPPPMPRAYRDLRVPASRNSVGGRAPPVPGGAADCRHASRGLPRSPGPRRDRLAVAALSPVLLRSRLRRGPTPNLAGAPRRDHGRAWGGEGRPPHVARPLRMRPRSDQGAAPLVG